MHTTVPFPEHFSPEVPVKYTNDPLFHGIGVIFWFGSITSTVGYPDDAKGIATYADDEPPGNAYVCPPRSLNTFLLVFLTFWGLIISYSGDSTPIYIAISHRSRNQSGRAELL
jgi:hypothetical protein